MAGYTVSIDAIGDRNHLHVCRSCGNVMATASTTGPEECFNCEGTEFSRYISLPEPEGED